MKNKFLCIHGHFYQPPRENPWLEEVEEEPSARPYHDWNERIFHECYGPNTASAILDSRGRVEELVDNYRLISFNIGPTLLSWMERRQPETYRAVLAADRASAAERGGHGNALAQAYNHIILPLATARDKRTQVRWGLADFRHRFGRDAEGMWLPECAVDEETLEVLAEEGVRFTVLAPSQAARVRPLDAAGAEWTAVDAATLDTTRPYRWLSARTPGRHVDIFFYDRALAHGVAFEGLLHDGARFAKRLIEPFVKAASGAPQLVHLATDGESYGHHHRWGNMALSFALRCLRAEGGVRLTNYGEFLSLFPPVREVAICPRTSWSCSHGIRRWADDCGCSTGSPPDWRQPWRKPMREALDWLAEELDAVYETRARGLFADPWASRDAYIGRMLSPDAASTDRFLGGQAGRSLTLVETEEALKLFEMQRHRMLMYTSCGWFFSDISGTESTQVLKYAARAIDLAEDLGGADPGARLRPRFEAKLERCPSNDEAYRTGAAVYRRLVAPLRADLARAAAHFSILDALERAPAVPTRCAYAVERRAFRRLEKREDGKDRSLTLERMELTCLPTLDSAAFTAVVHHRGRLDLECWVKKAAPEESSAVMEDLGAAFSSLSEAEWRRRVLNALGAARHGVHSLFTDELRRWTALDREAAAHLPGAAWRAAVRRLLADPSGLREAMRALRSASESGTSADRLPDVSVLRRRIAEAFWAFAAGGGPSAAELEAALLDAQAAGLTLDLWELQAAFWLWRARVRLLGASAGTAPEDDGAGLARQLNFAPSGLATVND